MQLLVGLLESETLLVAQADLTGHYDRQPPRFSDRRYYSRDSRSES